jgi:hypothetical protein
MSRAVNIRYREAVWTIVSLKKPFVTVDCTLHA